MSDLGVIDEPAIEEPFLVNSEYFLFLEEFFKRAWFPFLLRIFM